MSHISRSLTPALLLCLGPLLAPAASGEDNVPTAAVEAQPLAANVSRLREALEFLGRPLPQQTALALDMETESQGMQRLLDRQVVLAVQLSPDAPPRVLRGQADAQLQQAGYVPVIIKVLNPSRLTTSLRIASPQSGPVYAGAAELSLTRQNQLALRNDENRAGARDRFLQVEMYTDQPMAAKLSGLPVEYVVALFYSSAAGRREATIRFQVVEGQRENSSSGEILVPFEIRPAVPVTLNIRDQDGTPATARLTFLDEAHHVYPPQPKRLAPDFFFQQQIYRDDGGIVLLPPGELTMVSGRGPEYKVERRSIVIPESGPVTLDVNLKRWVDPRAYGFYSGDHHIHAAGCAHYTSPTLGVQPDDMLLQVRGEGLNVGCILTWGPCYEYQKQFFEPRPSKLSRALSLLKYDVEVSGFGSQALGHVCLLNLKDQTYPGSQGTTKHWPTWTTPVLRWAKKQGAVVGYAHSASGLEIKPVPASDRLLAQLDADRDGRISLKEASAGLLPVPVGVCDADHDGFLTLAELEESHMRAADLLPNYAIPEMDGVGAQEICVTVAQGLCDFISAMDTPRLAEWNCWYHLLNCGFPLKVSGETDFPCMSGTRVGQGRVYVQLGKVDSVDFTAWCEGLAQGRSYVSDGYAHALEFTVNGQAPGTRVELDRPQRVTIHAKVAFSPETPKEVPYGTIAPAEGWHVVGDTVNFHELADSGPNVIGGSVRGVGIVVNGKCEAAFSVPADGQIHEYHRTVQINRSSWVALRQFPQLHTNTVEVRVRNEPIRASRKSALWCIGVIEQLWRTRSKLIDPAERAEARKTFDAAIALYRSIAAEAPAGN